MLLSIVNCHKCNLSTSVSSLVHVRHASESGSKNQFGTAHRRTKRVIYPNVSYAEAIIVLKLAALSGQLSKFEQPPSKTLRPSLELWLNTF